MKNRGAGLLFVHENRILLLRKAKKQVWDIPGGQKNSEEDYLDAAKRETKEEIGKLPKYTQFAEYLYESEKNKFKIYFVKPESTFKCKLSDEHEAWGWFNIDNLPHRLHRKVRGAIEDLKSILDKKSRLNDWFTAF